MMKKFGFVLLAVCLMAAVVACGSGGTQAAASAGPASPLVGNASEEYYMVSFLSGIDYWKICFQGMQDAAKLYGVTAQYTGQIDADAAGQVAVLEQVIAKKPKGITITAVDTNALADTINSAVNQGIAVVTFDSDSPTSKRASYISTGNEAAGIAAAQFLAPQVGNKGRIAVVYTVGSENQETRVAGFSNWIKANAPAIRLTIVNDGGDTTKAADNAAAALQANNDIVAVFCVSGISGSVVPTAVKESGRKGVKILTFDVDRAVLDMLKAGDIDGTVAQGQYNMGYWSQVFLYHLAHNLPAKALPGFLDTGVTIVTKEHADEYYVK
ncbi:MAG: substrate-binding domain-containing protein [Spirochaetaceae bacterium]|jgi:ribose transport system substrate-binding protein|nr:substrate-binding domain-containing protein [Spirochaetaceae bacterium]